jgi:GT2 family glycosyltransferase
LLGRDEPCYHRHVEAPAVSVIIVTYQSHETIGACLASIAAHAGVPVEAIVVDNASTDGTCELARDQFPHARIVHETHNRGFAAACNAGARLASAPDLLFLNPDAELRPRALRLLAEFLRRSPRIAAVGPRLVYPDGAEQDSAFDYPSLLMTWLEFFPRPGRILHTRLNGRITSPHGAPVAIDHPLGACMLIRRAAWEDVGPFDEGFFLYCEEVDWCLRAKERGWQIWHVPTATVTHHGGVSSASARAASLVYLYRSRQRLHAKHRGRAFRLAARCITRLGLTQERRRLRRLQARSTNVSTDIAARLAGIECALQVLH